MDGTFDVVCQTTLALAPYQGPAAFVAEYAGIIRHRPGTGEPPTTVGGFRLYKVLRGLAMSYGHEVHAVCRAHSPALLRYCRAVFDRRLDSFRTEVEGRFHCLGADLLILDSLTLAQRWRGHRLGLLAVRRLLDVFEGGCGLVVCKPSPWEGAGAHGKVRLRRYFKHLGFRRIGKTGYYGLSTADIV